jgi:hypothetical protein
MAQVEIRIIGQTRQEVEAALAHLGTMEGFQVRRDVRRGRKGDWLAYATVSVSTEDQMLLKTSRSGD